MSETPTSPTNRPRKSNGAKSPDQKLSTFSKTAFIQKRMSMVQAQGDDSVD